MQIEGGFYVLPSKSHLANNTAFKDEKTFTLSSLQNRAFDTELGVLVRNFKGLSIGDKITLEDEIKLIRYDKDLDETFFGFEEFGGTITEWPFNGDLTSEFTVGEKVAFKFEIVKEHSDGPFETLDYIKYGLDNNGKAPKIDKFLK